MSALQIRFGPAVSAEINTMLTASSESGVKMAQDILSKQHGRVFFLSQEQAKYLAENLCGDSDRVSQACGKSLGAAFERAGDKLSAAIKNKWLAARSIPPVVAGKGMT